MTRVQTAPKETLFYLDLFEEENVNKPTGQEVFEENTKSILHHINICHQADLRYGTTIIIFSVIFFAEPNQS